MYACETCPREYDREFLIVRHMNARGHWAERFECQTCDWEFLSELDCFEHMDEEDHWVPQFLCETCDYRFFQEQNCVDHMNEEGHWEPTIPCEARECTYMFHSHQEARTHMDATNHWRRYYCKPCKKGFQNENNLRMHLNGAAHKPKPVIPCEAPECPSKFRSELDARAHMDATNHWHRFYCKPCKKGFQNENNLRMHLNGHAHQPVPPGSLRCPCCNRCYTNATGLVSHLESGSCPRAGNMNRETIFKLINRYDTTGVITNKQLTWQENQNTSNIATNASWNGYGFECYLCHREFDTLKVLNQHLASLAHKQKIYHCFGRGCSKEFTALAGLVNHLESESCGAMRFSTVQSNISGVLSGRKMLGC